MTVTTSTPKDTKVKAHTPMIAQYLSVKESQPDALLFYRMGDFYEMFFEDAEIGARVLGITLTKRGKADGDDIPMCGVPVHSVDGYLARLIKAGHRVAICEQSESPEAQKKRGGKGPLKRAVVRVLTPGTLTEDELLSPRSHNFLVALARAGDSHAVAWADMSTGDFLVQDMTGQDPENLIARLDPAELVMANNIDFPAWVEEGQFCVSPQAPSLFDSSLAAVSLQNFYGVSSLDGFGNFTRAMLAAAGGLLGYIEATQLGNMPRLRPLQPIIKSGYMEIDPATRRSLELTRTLSGDTKGSLFHAIDRTQTAAGARLLGSRIAAPLGDVAAINQRLDMVSWFHGQHAMCDDMHQRLGRLPDLDRALTRLAMGHGGPRDLASLANGLALAAEIVDIVTAAKGIDEPAYLGTLYDTILAPSPLAGDLLPALGDDLPLLARDGGFVRRGYDLPLDEIRDLRDESRRLIAGLQQRYCDETGIAALKIKHNNVLGYHIDVRAAHGDKLMQMPLFIHRQTTAQTVRFTTIELGEMERDMASAADRALAKELAIFENLRQSVLAHGEAISAAARALAELDVAAASAVLARNANYCRPELRDTIEFSIEKGRHPVIETVLDRATPFIANDCELPPESNLWLLTGPNMAGKSTFLRQNAHIAIMAQAGLFVPADRAIIGVIDRIFSRVGAADDLARGRSTFMVEMVETAAILNGATERSFVILDEIGRGTATYDGLAIAWATLEHLHEICGCRTLFATHYHELTNLEQSLARLSSHAMQVREWQGSIIFLHQVVAGAADRSYGVHVARLAGLPANVLERAGQILSELEAGDHGAMDANAMAASLPLFDHSFNAEPVMDVKADPSPVLAELDNIHPDELSPREALELIYKLKNLKAETGR